MLYFEKIGNPEIQYHTVCGEITCISQDCHEQKYMVLKYIYKSTWIQ